MKLGIALASVLLLLTGITRSAQANDSIRNVDFQNFTYTLQPGGMGPSGTITLTDGVYRNEYGSAGLSSLRYGDLNGNGVEDVIVILRANGGGSGVSSHAFGFTSNNGYLERILYRMNFINIHPLTNGFILVNSSPQSTGHQNCSANSFVRSNALEIETYWWNGSNFVLSNTHLIRNSTEKLL
ncbi:hypothetical protein C7B61_00945 [filamentous cyanobacterium CCP1]|nr:hypothetical protein C7B76_12610 [filamentous cyanobacterium CCP2]PSB68428.1 hypothetical protein C7B61_00945 [filamentous cyanobacterium CCP1]